MPRPRPGAAECLIRSEGAHTKSDNLGLQQTITYLSAYCFHSGEILGCSHQCSVVELFVQLILTENKRIEFEMYVMYSLCHVKCTS